MNTPRRTVRIEDELWTAAVDKAHKEGTTVTEVLRKALDAYVKAGAVVLVAFGLLTIGASAPVHTEEVAVVTVTAPSAAAAALMIAASCNADVGAVVAEIANTSDQSRADLDAFYAAGEAWQVEQARAKYAAGIPLVSAC